MSRLTPRDISPIDEFDAFISYSTDPDYALSRRIESFLEGFHRLPTAADVTLKQLQACRDGSDFTLRSVQKQQNSEVTNDQAVTQVLIEYLQKSTYLLVLCSANAAQSKYVNFEIKWFAENKGKDKILLAVSEGEDPLSEKERFFSPELLYRNIQNEIFYDLRGFQKKSKQWRKVRDFEEELTKLAAHLNNESAGKILPIWRTEETRKLKRQRLLGIVATLFFLMLSVGVFILWRKSVENEKEAIENLRKYELEQFQRNIRNGDIFLDANEYSLARTEYKMALAISEKYPDDSSILSKRSRLAKSILRCDLNLKL